MSTKSGRLGGLSRKVLDANAKWHANYHDSSLTNISVIRTHPQRNKKEVRFAEFEPTPKSTEPQPAGPKIRFADQLTNIDSRDKSEYVSPKCDDMGAQCADDGEMNGVRKPVLSKFTFQGPVYRLFDGALQFDRKIDDD
ncbi:hypothetical protein N0V90_008666 [Kalmusia sp. IMI 367209]|nr:hypothetical protein N0V90_008666 [Kalmusia sp. IMI 367209]